MNQQVPYTRLLEELGRLVLEAALLRDQVRALALENQQLRQPPPPPPVEPDDG